MQLYRLARKEYAANPFDPTGARLYGGRWNSKGNAALYFAASESLYVLEVFVHVSKEMALQQRYDLYRIELPDALIARLLPEDLPAKWRAIPPTETTQQLGDQFLREPTVQFAALQLPSVISPRDYNYLLNPRHPALAAIFASAERLEFAFDLRIFK